MSAPLLFLPHCPHPSFLTFVCPLLSHSALQSRHDHPSVKPSSISDPSNPTFPACQFQLPVLHLYSWMNGSVIFKTMSLQLVQEERFNKKRNHFTKNTCSSHCLVEIRSLSPSEKHNSCMGGKDNKQTATAAVPQGGVIQGLLSSSYLGSSGPVSHYHYLQRFNYSLLEKLISPLAELWTCSDRYLHYLL